MLTLLCCCAIWFILFGVIALRAMLHALFRYLLYRRKLRAWVKYTGLVASHKIELDDETYSRLWNEADEAYLAFRKVYRKIKY